MNKMTNQQARDCLICVYRKVVEDGLILYTLEEVRQALDIAIDNLKEHNVVWEFKHTKHKAYIQCECGYQTLDSKAKFCPNCGGKVVWKKETENDLSTL